MKDTEKILQLLQEQEIIRPRELGERGISPASLYWLHKQGKLMRTSRGIYMRPDREVSEHHSLLEACQRVSHGVVCLLSALSFHGLGTQLPFEIWMAVDVKARLPKVNYPPIRFVRFSGQAMNSGIDEYHIEGVTLRVFSPEKTIADCFKYRHKIGLDIAIEALRDCRPRRSCSEAKLWQFAKICRVSKIMKPYLEATA